MSQKLNLKMKKSELENLVNEGIWDSLKHMASKWGSLEKGGKLTGKDEYVAKAGAQFKNTLDKHSNATVKKLVDEIKQEFPEFPNMKDKWQFLNAVSAIAVFYDSLAAAVEKFKEGKSEDEGAMAPDVANGLVEALREYVRTLLDVDLADVYKHFNEEEEHHGEELLDEVDWAKKERELAAEEEAAAGIGKAEKEGPEDVLKTKEKSGTWKGLESNALPMALGLAGAGFGAAHMALAKLYLGPSGKEVFQGVEELHKQNAPEEEYIEFVEQRLGEDQSLKGGNFLSLAAPPGGDTADFAANVDYYAEKTGRPAEEIVSMLANQNPKSDFGGELSNEAAQLLYKFNKEGADGASFWGAIGNSSRAPSRAFQQFAAENGASDKLLDILKQPGSMSGSPKAAGTLIGVASGNYGLDIPGLTKMVGQVLKKQAGLMAQKAAVTTGAGAAATAATGTKLGAIVAGSGILSTIGIGLGAAAGAVKLLRLKGRKSSRAQVLNDLEGTLKDFQGEGPLGGDNEDECPEGQVMGADGKCHGMGVLPPEPEPEPDPPGPPPPEPPEDNVTRLGLARLDDDGVKIYIGTRKKEDARKIEKDLMQAAEDEAIVGGNTSPSTDTLDKEFKKDRRAPDPIRADYDAIVKRIKGRSKREPDPHFTVDKSVMSDIRKRLGSEKRSGIPNSAIDKLVTSALKAYLDQKGKINARDVTQGPMWQASMGGVKVDNDQKDILLNALISYGLVRPTKARGGLKARSQKMRKASRQKRKEKKAAEKAAAPEALQESRNREILDRWKTISGLK